MQLQTTSLANKIRSICNSLFYYSGWWCSFYFYDKMCATSFQYYYYRQNKLKEILTVGAMQEVGEVSVKRLVVRGLFPRITQMWQALLLFPHTSGACVPVTHTLEVAEAHSTDMGGHSTHADSRVEGKSIVQETGSLNRVSERG